MLPLSWMLFNGDLLKHCIMITFVKIFTFILVKGHENKRQMKDTYFYVLNMS